MWRLMPAMTASALLTGCYQPDVDGNCRISCTVGVTPCPDSLTCGTDGLCYTGATQCSEQPPPDADVTADGDTSEACGALMTATAVTINAVTLSGSYIPSDDRTVATYATGGAIYEQTNVDGGTGTSTSQMELYPRLFPESTAGDIRVYALTSGGGLVLLEGAGGTWTRQGPGPITLDGDSTLAATERISNPSATTPRHLVRLQSSSMLTEYTSSDALVYTSVRNYSTTDLGVGGFGTGSPSLTPDGLGLVFAGSPSSTGGPAIYYASRAAITDPFSPAVVLRSDSVALTSTPYLESGCARLYWTGTDSVLRRVP